MAREFTLADGQVAATAGTLIAGSSVPTNFVNVVFANTGVREQTVEVTFQRSGGTARRIARAKLKEDEQLIILNQPMNTDDTLLAVADFALLVDYLVTGSGGGGYEIYVMGADGTPKRGTNITLETTEKRGLTDGEVVISGYLEQIRDTLLKIA